MLIVQDTFCTGRFRKRDTTFWFRAEIARHARPACTLTHSEDILSSPAAHCRTTSTPCAALRLLFSRYSSEPKGAGLRPTAGTRKRRQVPPFFSLFTRAKRSPCSTAGRCCCCFLSSGAERSTAASFWSQRALFPSSSWAHSWLMLVRDGSTWVAHTCRLLLMSLMRELFGEEGVLKYVVLRAPASKPVSATQGEGDRLLTPLRGRRAPPEGKQTAERRGTAF